MLTCLICRRTHPKGTLICTGCGRSLLPKRNTSALEPLSKTTQGRQREPAPAPNHPPKSSAIGSLRLTVVSSKRLHTFRTNRSLIIGRSDVQRGFYPDLDLTPDGGVTAGVSRSHARISFERGGCRIEDLGSANGTLVNGLRLMPHFPHSLATGDEIQVGTIVLTVELRDELPGAIKLIQQ